MDDVRKFDWADDPFPEQPSPSVYEQAALMNARALYHQAQNEAHTAGMAALQEVDMGPAEVVALLREYADRMDRYAKMVKSYGG